jgi:hypothetical protein
MVCSTGQPDAYGRKLNATGTIGPIASTGTIVMFSAMALLETGIQTTI